MTVSKRLRYEIFRRDNHACRYCGAAAPDATLSIDHVVPVTLGGSDEPSNLVTACEPCNAGKSASSTDAPLVADVEQDALRWAQAMEQAAERRAAELANEQTLTGWFEEHWNGWTVNDEPIPLGAGWGDSVVRFVAAGLDKSFIKDSIQRAMEKSHIRHYDVWRYFCGICWRELDKRRDIAANILNECSGAADGVRTYDNGGYEFPYLPFAEMFMDELMSTLRLDATASEVAREALRSGLITAECVYYNNWRVRCTEDDSIKNAADAMDEDIAPYMSRIAQANVVMG